MKNKMDAPNKTSVSTAVIVAAGMGTRLGKGKLPKPLMPLVGVPLIARVMDSAAKAGIVHFIIVIGHEAGVMRAHLPGLAPAGCGLTLIENRHYTEPNGVSLLAGIQGLNEPFALLMSDHIFSPGRLERAMKEFDSDGVPRLVVEKKSGFTGDIDDATLVKVEHGFISAIGKDLTEYEAIDTGMFVLCPELVKKAAEKAGPSPNISGLMRGLGKKRKLKALYGEGGYWQDVDTFDDIKEAEKKLYASLVKSADGFMARHINRRVSLFISTRIWRFGLTPNMVTTFTLVMGILAGLAFSVGNAPVWGLLGAALFQIHSIIDGVDGELARLLLKSSRLGFWYDMTADNVAHIAIFSGIAMGQKASGVPGPWNALAVLAVLGIFASVIAVSPLLRPYVRSKGMETETGALKKVVNALTSRDFSYALFPLAILNWLGGFLWIVTIGTWIYSILVILLRIKARKKAAA